jgi:3-carboxy-cis,cis-muconate cycloisomerase
MSPSSSPAESEPFGFLVATGPVAAATTSSAWLQAMLDAEAALVLAQGDVGVVPADSAERIAAACRVERFDLGAIEEQAALGGNAVIALVPALRALVSEADTAHVHRGATSQDIVDAATAFVVARCAESVRSRLDSARSRAIELGHRYGETRMIARTLGQHAVPTTFATVTARWADAFGDAAAGLAAPEVSLGGPSGDGTSYGEHRDAIVERFAARLGLTPAPAARHSQRTGTVVTAGQWAVVATAASKVALDVIVLAQSDVGELSESANGAGVSSSMAHKHNPIAAISARAAAMQVPGLVATLVQAAGSHELERAAGAWHAEWPALHALLRSAGSAVEWVHRSLDRIVVHPDRMEAKLR